MSRWWLVAYAALAAAHLVLVGIDADGWADASKVGPVPVLIVLGLVRHLPPRILIALGACVTGDALLLGEDRFAFGMLAFAIAHAFFIGYFISRNAWASLKVNRLVPALIGLGAVLLVAAVWTGLDDTIVKVGLPIYAALLAAMAGFAWSFEKRAGFGALAFVASDALIALSYADKVPSGRVTDIAIMALYFAAMWLITTAILEREARPAVFRAR